MTASGSLRRIILGPELRFGAILATGSPRREAQLRLLRADLSTVAVRGNIDTRLRKFRENEEWSRPDSGGGGSGAAEARSRRTERDEDALFSNASRAGPGRAGAPNADGKLGGCSLAGTAVA